MPLPGLNWALSTREWFAPADLKNDIQSPGKRYSTDSRQYMEGGQNASCELGWLAEFKSRVLHLLTGTAGQLNLSASVSSSVKWDAFLLYLSLSQFIYIQHIVSTQ